MTTNSIFLSSLFKSFFFFVVGFFKPHLPFDKIECLAIPQLTTREQSRCSGNFYYVHWKNAIRIFPVSSEGKANESRRT